MYNELMTYQHLGDHIGEMDIQSLPAYPSHKRVERATQSGHTRTSTRQDRDKYRTSTGQAKHGQL